MNEEDYPPMCCICGMPDSICTLIRFTFRDDGAGRLLHDMGPNGDESFRMCSIVIAKRPKDNDSLVCEDCIRGIKRVAFSELESGRFIPPPLKLKRPPDDTITHPNGDVEIPF